MQGRAREQDNIVQPMLRCMFAANPRAATYPLTPPAGRGIPTVPASRTAGGVLA